MVACALAPGLRGLGAETRALLVGVSDYDESIGLTDLRGPANDVRLLAGVLRGRGVQNVEILADGVEGSARPTRGAILSAFDTLARDAVPGDFVYIHLSGHGTRQKDPEGDEADGLDEVFLPADTARAAPGAGVIPNAITDDEIGAAVDAIRARGADVWLVMDSCHAGSGLRAAAPQTAARYVDPAVLGVTASTNPRPEAGIMETRAQDLPGGVLAFYAARSSEVAREVNLAPEGRPEAWYGLFSSRLAARLETGAGLSFRQVFQAVLSDMNDGSVPGAARLQTPLWEGNLIDAAVFGGAGTVGLRRFAVTGDEIAAGLVHGLGDGTLVGLVADAADPPDALIGFAQMEATEATSALLRPVAGDCTPRSDTLCPQAGLFPAAARFAQVVSRPVDLTVRIAPPVDMASGAALDPDHPALVALRAAAEETGTVISASEHEVETLWADGQLWFGPRAAIGRTPVGLAWRPGTPLAPLLHRIVRAETLARMLASAGDGGSLLNPNPVAIEAALRPVSTADLAAPGSGVSPRRECRSAQARAAQWAPLPAGADLKQCDQIAFTAQGRVAGARDVNRIHIDAQYCVTAAYQRVEDARMAIPLGPGMTLCSDCPGGYSAGEERLFIVVTEGRQNAEALNLEGLVETCADTGGGTRGAAVRDFLDGLARRPDTRGAFGAFGVADIWVDRFSWRVLPKQEAFARDRAN